MSYATNRKIRKILAVLLAIATVIGLALVASGTYTITAFRGRPHWEANQFVLLLGLTAVAFSLFADWMNDESAVCPSQSTKASQLLSPLPGNGEEPKQLEWMTGKVARISKALKSCTYTERTEWMLLVSHLDGNNVSKEVVLRDCDEPNFPIVRVGDILEFSYYLGAQNRVNVQQCTIKSLGCTMSDQDLNGGANLRYHGRIVRRGDTVRSGYRSCWDEIVLAIEILPVAGSSEKQVVVIQHAASSFSYLPLAQVGDQVEFSYEMYSVYISERKRPRLTFFRVEAKSNADHDAICQL